MRRCEVMIKSTTVGSGNSTSAQPHNLISAAPPAAVQVTSAGSANPATGSR